MPREPRTPQRELHDAYDALYRKLDDAYWVATTIEDKDRIRGTATAVFDLMTSLNQADLRARATEMLSLTEAIGLVNQRLTRLKQDIDRIVQVIRVAGELTRAIDGVVSRAARFAA